MLDIEAAAAHSGLDPEDVELIAAAFEGVAKESIVQLSSAVELKDKELASQVLHKLAGSSAAILGFGAVNQIAQEGEEGLKTGRNVDLQKYCDRLTEALAQMGIEL